MSGKIKNIRRKAQLCSCQTRSKAAKIRLRLPHGFRQNRYAPCTLQRQACCGPSGGLDEPAPCCEPCLRGWAHLFSLGDLPLRLEGGMILLVWLEGGHGSTPLPLPAVPPVPVAERSMSVHSFVALLLSCLVARRLPPSRHAARWRTAGSCEQPPVRAELQGCAWRSAGAAGGCLAMPVQRKYSGNPLADHLCSTCLVVGWEPGRPKEPAWRVGRALARYALPTIAFEDQRQVCEHSCRCAQIWHIAWPTDRTRPTSTYPTIA